MLAPGVELDIDL